MDTWHRFWGLSAFQRTVVLEAAAALTATYVGLRLAGFRRCKTALERLTRRASLSRGLDGGAKARMGVELARMQAATARYLPFRINCLEQSLVLWWLLRRHGLLADLKIGARKEAGRFEAHAWVVFDGGVIGDAGEQHLHFAPFAGALTSGETQAQ